MTEKNTYHCNTCCTYFIMVCRNAWHAQNKQSIRRGNRPWLCNFKIAYITKYYILEDRFSIGLFT